MIEDDTEDLGEEKVEELGEEEKEEVLGEVEKVVTPEGSVSFRRYTEIYNYETSAQLSKVTSEGFTDPEHEWVITEKVHGANFSITTSGNGLVCAKRTSILLDTDVFYGWREVVNELQPKIMVMYGLLKEKFNDVTDVVFYGEIFGGMYPHPNVKKIPDVKHVQKGVYYSPVVNIYFFDIWVRGHSFISYDLFESVCSTSGVIYAKALQRGPFSQLIKFDIESFITTLPSQFGLPPITEGIKNVAEGIVLKPVNNKYLARGGRVILKYKSTNFKEVTGAIPNPDKKKKEKVPFEPKNSAIPDHLLYFSENITRYVTENRLRNVISKIGEVKRDEKAKLSGLFTRDVVKDFKEDFGKFLELPKNEQKIVMEKMSNVAAKMVNLHFEDIIKNEF